MFEEYLSRSSRVTPPSFVRGILKAGESEEMISFAGGLPNPISFPEAELKESMMRVVDTYHDKVFQYSATAGLPALREYIADKYKNRDGMEITADDIIITTGSQQALDLIGKTFLDQGDGLLIEEPGYLGAIQCFTQYEPQFVPVTLQEDGINVTELREKTEHFQKENRERKLKLAYIVPNYQNPSGLTYSEEKRGLVSDYLYENDVILIEDDPYGELSFDGKINGYISKTRIDKSILLGTFSKTVTPGMRIGYMIIKNPVIRKAINTAKEAADLHTNIFSQYVIWDYLTHNDVAAHIREIVALYKTQCETMIAAMEQEWPKDVTFTRPTGGMFLWATLPHGCSAMNLFEKAKAKQVAFVPGNPFYTDYREAQTMRLNYTNASEAEIKEGIKRIGELFS